MSLSVLATGDSLFTADFPGNYKKIRASLDDFIKQTDLKLTNLETNVSDFGNFPNQYSGGTWINVRKDLFRYLQTYGFDFYGTANNHCMDYSYAGLLSTIDFLDEKGVAHAGTGRSLEEAEAPAILTVNGKNVAVFAIDTSFEKPSMAGKKTNTFKARPGVNFLRYTSNYYVSSKDIDELRRIADETSLNFNRNLKISTGFALPDKDGMFNFGGIQFTTDRSTPKTECNKKDLKRLIDNIIRAKETCDYVFILIHCHENDGESHVNPPAFLREFCYKAIEAGANAIFGGGCHELRGMEVYKAAPIFYSLGDFIYQGMRVEYLPADFMEIYGVDINATAKEGLDARSQGGKIGLQTQKKNFLTVLPRITFEDGKLTGIKIMPVKLGFNTGDEFLEGLPFFAEGTEGENIYNRFKELSVSFGTKLSYKDGLIKVEL